MKQKFMSTKQRILIGSKIRQQMRTEIVNQLQTFVSEVGQLKFSTSTLPKVVMF